MRCGSDSCSAVMRGGGSPSQPPTRSKVGLKSALMRPAPGRVLPKCLAEIPAGGIWVRPSTRALRRAAQDENDLGYTPHREPPHWGGESKDAREATRNRARRARGSAVRIGPARDA